MSSTKTVTHTEGKRSAGGKQSLHQALFTLAGPLLSSFAGKVLNAPIYLISTVSKVDQELVRQNRLDRPFTGPIDASTRIFKAEGVLGLWRGFVLNIPGYYLVPALNFASKNIITRTFFKHHNKDPYWIQFLKVLISGIVSGTLSTALVHPFKITSFKYLTDVPSTSGRKYSGILSIWKDIFTNDGILGFFTGFGAQTLALILFRVLYFGGYDLYRTLIRRPKSRFESFWLNWGSTLFATAATYPLAVIQDRLMITAGSNKKYSSMTEMLNEIWINEGLAGFWRGFAISLATGSSFSAARAIFNYIKPHLDFFIWRPRP